MKLILPPPKALKLNDYLVFKVFMENLPFIFIHSFVLPFEYSAPK